MILGLFKMLIALILILIMIVLIGSFLIYAVGVVKILNREIKKQRKKRKS